MAQKMRKAKDIGYYAINAVILIITAILFISNFYKVGNSYQNESVRALIVLFITVILVHFIKAARLFFALYGTDITLSQYMRTYCKVTPVSVVLPFKIGELFRMYCYGKQIGSLIKGIVIVLLDRFMDTIALLTMIIIVWSEGLGYFPGIIYLLLIFAIGIVLIYFAFPGIYRFWKKYLLHEKASEYKLWSLNMLEAMQNIYLEIERVAKGRGVILYMLSLISWGIEIGSISIINKIERMEDTSSLISIYLSSAISGNQPLPLSRFIFVSVISLMFVYIILKLIGNIIRKEEKI